MCGYYRLDAGAIYVGNTRIDQLSAQDVVRNGLARTFQTPRLLNGKTALENVVLGADAHAGAQHGERYSTHHMASGQSGRLRAGQALRYSMWIDEESWSQAGVIPHGTQRLVEIARAITLEPTFLLLDEPGAGLSVAEVEILSKTVRRLADGGIGVLLVEHNLPIVFGLADEVTVLHRGQGLRAGRPNRSARTRRSSTFSSDGRSWIGTFDFWTDSETRDGSNGNIGS